MSYIIDQFNKGEVKWVDGACGWIVDNEFRPLMADALAELFKAGKIESIDVSITNDARAVTTMKVIEAYKKSQAQRSPDQIAEERAMARAAFGLDADLVDVFTGERF